MNDGNDMVLVEYLDENLAHMRGKFAKVSLKKALLGERDGKWKIICNEDNTLNYSNKELRTDKTRALGLKNLFGNDYQSNR